MKDRAYAKINLSLDVFNIREDGYHDLSSIMLPIDFYDELEINIATQDSFVCDKSFIRYNEHNSIYKMISILKERYGISDHHEIKLKKVVPMQAGLGGGTADAASTLRIFEKLYDLDIDRQEAIEICTKVGADVPFNYFNVPAVVAGIGDVIEPFEIKKRYYVLLVKPRSGISTKAAYETLDMEICDHPDIQALRKALENGESLKGLLGNSLEQPALILNDDIRRVKEELSSYGVGEVLMSGSGSTVFCIDEDFDKIRKLSYCFRGSGNYVRFTKILSSKRHL
ncbi:MAG: 4-(cytidine 5'-diphospho)-2-C-methyl-D-erythritol kinase [Erysipelotrichaceae bacterium]|nr:4-(cytidine 5'-diphospho)-2-C-methyl-D-erythritol kinase [Erysipelotrichaceae bacterium]